MKVSSRVDYAMSCLIVIAQEHDKGIPVPVKKVAAREALEVDYVEQLLIQLKRAGILKSVRGIKGGYLLTRDPEDITTLEILRAFEGEILELVCFRKKGRKSACIHLEECELRRFWIEMGEVMEEYLARNTLRYLVELRAKEKTKGEYL